ncbi:MAG: hypothetical protein QOI99_2431, partial [Actinomycetota bacterium]|nr:hypothetical protein [Actinomycetota bacterium]
MDPTLKDPTLKDPGTPGTPGTFVARPRPERRLVTAMIAVSVVCVGLWWAGAVGPRVTAVVRSVEAGTAAGRGTIHVEVRNHGRLAVRVRGVRVDDRQGPKVELGPVRVDGRDLPPEGVPVAGGEVARLDVAYTVECDAPRGYGADPAVGVRVRAPLGVTHTRFAGTDALSRSRTGGDE